MSGVCKEDFRAVVILLGRFWQVGEWVVMDRRFSVDGLEGRGKEYEKIVSSLLG